MRVWRRKCCLSALAILVSLGAGCGGSEAAPASGSYQIRLLGDGDGCGIEDWSLAQESAVLDVSGPEANLALAFAPAEVGEELILQTVLSHGVLHGTAEGRRYEAEAVSEAAIGTCNSRYRVLVTGRFEEPSVLGEITYEPVDPCAELEPCTATQVFDGERIER